ncbi:hypothetical protein BCD48_23165 [Pseudofrankia sp. BMG5.36]|nr:hypothetical protein BCD48_23165 [Pseudofrankia sp. BMG5.36]
MNRRRGAEPLAGQISLPFDDHEQATGAADLTRHVTVEMASTAGSVSLSVPAVVVAEECARPVGVGGWDRLPARSETGRQYGATGAVSAGLGSAEPDGVQVTVPT